MQFVGLQIMSTGLFIGAVQNYPHFQTYTNINIYIYTYFQVARYQQKMRQRNQRNSLIQQQRSNLKSSQKKLKGLKKNNFFAKSQQNLQPSSVMGSNQRNNINFHVNANMIESQFLTNRQDQVQILGLQYFKQKYAMSRDSREQNLADQMRQILNLKRNQIQSLRIYRDQFKFMSKGNNNQPIKITLQTLKQKVQIEQKLIEHKALIQKQLRKADKQIDSLQQYQKFMQGFLQTSQNNPNEAFLDLSKEQQVMLKNLQSQKDMLIRQLAEQQKRNSREIRQIQDQIMEYRITIKDKEDILRNLKSKICTLYIKLHSRNNSRMGSKSKDRNMSLSIRKFNNINHSSIKQAYIGNKTFKSYAKQVIQKVSSQQQLIKIKFYSASVNSGQTNKNKQQLFFQCFYKNRDGQIHDDRNLQATNDDDATRDKMSSDSNQRCEEIYVKYLSSMKFFYKSKIVGVQCRVKTERGNKHIYIGNCQAHVEHQLLTLVNKKVVTLGSFWHGKQMIGISVWYSDRLRMLNQAKKPSQQSLKKQAYQQYYS